MAFENPVWHVAMPEQFDGTTEMLTQFAIRNLCAVVVMQRAIYAGHLFHVLQDGTYVVTHDDDGTVVIDGVEHLVHLLLKTLVDVGVGFIKYHYLGARNDGPGQEYALQLSTAERSDGAMSEIFHVDATKRFVHLLMMLFGERCEEGCLTTQAREYDLGDGDGELPIDVVILG